MATAFESIRRRLRAVRPHQRRAFHLSQIDQLETRILPTATVSFTGTLLTITGDTSGNEVLVERVGTQLHVAGENATVINVLGSNVSDFYFPLKTSFNFNATFQGGDDRLRVIGGLDLRSVNIAMGDGENFVSLYNTALSGKLTIKSGIGQDTVSLFSVSVISNTLIDTGADNDFVEINEGKFIGSTTITTGLGCDDVRIGNVEASSRVKFVGKLTITTGDDRDFVRMQIAESKAFSIDTGNGRDDVFIDDVRTFGSVTVKTGEGEDSVSVSELFQTGSATNLFDLGTDRDELSLAVCVFAGSTTLNLGSGSCQLCCIDDVMFNQTFTLNTQGDQDRIKVERNAGYGGATTFSKPAKFNLGPSNTVKFGLADPASSVRFLSSVSLTGQSLQSTLYVVVANVSFASPPVLNNVVRINV